MREIILPMLLICGVNILYKWYQHNDLSWDIVIDTTETGYANYDTMLEWLQHFINHTKNKRRVAWLLFIIDGYRSHMIIPFHNLATKNKIVLFYLPLHSTYLIQLLDVGVFQPFKYYHINAIDKAVWLGDKKFGKLEFLAAFQLFRNQTFKSTIICHAFKSTDLVLFDPNVVLDKIREKQVQKMETAF